MLRKPFLCLAPSKTVVGKKRPKALFFGFVFTFFSSYIYGEPVHHDLAVSVDPASNFIKVKDSVTIPKSMLAESKLFFLNGDLVVTSHSENVTVASKPDKGASLKTQGVKEPVQPFSLSVPAGHKGALTFQVEYSGTINEPVEQLTATYARGFKETSGIVSSEGVFLSGQTHWVPKFNDDLVTFTLTVSLPDSWDAVSQGDRTLHLKENNRRKVRFESPEPMDEVYLIAAEFIEYSRPAGNVAAMAFLRTPDDRLANKYLEVTAQYLQMYEKLLGPFPYKKFALVENFWETGYGMPSFTLLGPRIIRFPFILHSSYPHELLHNWWGNSVFVDYESGNWSEGLTAYLADHLIKEQKGQGAEYRSGSLQKYADYVHKENDFSLSGFLSRRGDSTEAVGYGKSMMMWNMLRRLVGDEVFIRSFQHFYKNNKFKRASFNNIKKSFETVSQKELTFFFDQWVKRTGAPSLELSSLSVTTRKEDFQVSFSLSQTQKEAPYILNIPVAVYLEGMQEALVRNVSLAKKKENYQLVFSSRPLRVDIDPEFDIFRRLHRNEIPPSLSQAFGSEDILIILPFEAEKTVLEGYRTLALSWQTEKKNKIKIVFDNEISTLPKGKTVWVLGWKNRFQDRLMLALSGYDVQIEKQNVRFSGSVLHKEENSFIMVGRNPLSPEDALVFLGTDGPNALPGLGRKLPHYGKYSYLVFEGDEPTNIHKGRWPVINSPLTKNVAWENIPKTGIKRTGLPERKALAYLAPVFSEKAMMEHVQFLASEKLKGRGFGSEGLNEAADYIAGQFKKAGLQPAGDQGTFFQAFSETGGVEKKERLLKNVVALIPGKNPDFQTQSVILSAHYDHLGLGWPDVHHGDEGKIHFGADDNASGVSILIEIAKVLTKGGRPERTIIFVAFTGEEAGRFGSKHYIENTQKFPPERIIGVVNLDTVGRLEKNKVLVLGTTSAKEWKHIFMGSGFVTGVKNEIVSKDLDSSDQVSFIEKGIPAVQIFAGPRADYHRPSDTVEKIDAKGMVKIADFVREAVVYLADREGFLTTGEKKLSRPKKAGPKRGRKVRTGIMPDFSFAGRGVLIGKVSESSPADKAGLKKGDVVTRVDGHPLADLQEYSNRLKKYSPGDEVTFIYVRDGKENSTKIVLTVR